jgi:hypothetical protein
MRVPRGKATSIRRTRACTHVRCECGKMDAATYTHSQAARNTDAGRLEGRGCVEILHHKVAEAAVASNEQLACGVLWSSS